MVVVRIRMTTLTASMAGARVSGFTKLGATPGGGMLIGILDKSSPGGIKDSMFRIACNV